MSRFKVRERLRCWAGARLGRRLDLDVVFHDAYRLPLAGGDLTHLEVRRAEDALQFLLHARHVDPARVITPPAASYEALLAVHAAEYLDALVHTDALARIFSAEPSEVFAEGLMRALRLVCGGTIVAARRALTYRRAALNLGGGFHHARPSAGAGFCAINDVAVAVAALRAEGFGGRIGIIDVDFHPPDGTAACLGADPKVWLGSVSGVDWGPLPGVDETVLSPASDDAVVLGAVERLLGRMPPVDLAFVLAVADVLTGDPLGGFALSLGGVRQRDLTIARHLEGLPQVWLPAGGYTPQAWRALAGTALAVGRRSSAPVPLGYDPLRARLSFISHQLTPQQLGADVGLSDSELDEALHRRPPATPRFLGFYTAQGLELALERYQVLPYVRRLGFTELAAEVTPGPDYDRARLVGRDAVTGGPVVLIELEAARRPLAGKPVLFVNWLSLRNPRGQFSDKRPRLPGQEVPGLGLAKDITTLLGLMAKRLGLEGVAFRPSWFHMAYAARHQSHFVDPRRQGRFEALVRDTRSVPLLEATRAVAEGRVRLDGAPYAWEADEMVAWLEGEPGEAFTRQVVAARDRAHFELVSAAAHPPAAAPAPDRLAPSAG